jgi:hypothetical protein
LGAAFILNLVFLFVLVKLEPSNKGLIVRIVNLKKKWFFGDLWDFFSGISDGSGHNLFDLLFHEQYFGLGIAPFLNPSSQQQCKEYLPLSPRCPRA